jgi:hypothetical protein
MESSEMSLLFIYIPTADRICGRNRGYSLDVHSRSTSGRTRELHKAHGQYSQPSGPFA